MAQADLDLSAARSETFEMVWPPRSGQMRRFPEVDQVAYFPLEEALKKVHLGQRPILIEAAERIGREGMAARK
jgi:predicted NUDIX family NTP pyrophosphohydrolase